MNMTTKKRLHWFVALSCAIALAFVASLLAGCGGSPAPAPTVDAEDEASYLTPVIGAKALEDGRKVGGSAKGGIGDELANVFFTYRVDKAALADEFDGEKPERGFAFVVAEVTVINTFGEPLPMWADDFVLQWGDGDDEYAYPYPKYTDEQMEEEYMLDADDEVTATLLFEVPLQEGVREYNISYLEYYDDDVEGNMFYIIFDLSML